MENLKDFKLEHLMIQPLASLTTQCLVLLIIPNWENKLVPEDTMVGTNGYSNECNSLGITESYSEGITDRIIIGLKKRFIDGDLIWTANGSPDFISGCADTNEDCVECTLIGITEE